MAEMVQNSRSFLLLPSRFGSEAKSPLSPKSNLQIITVRPRSVGAGQLNSLTDKEKSRSLSHSWRGNHSPGAQQAAPGTELGVRHNIQWED